MLDPGTYWRSSRPLWRHCLYAAWLCLTLMAGGWSSPAGESAFEYRVKATFLFNFAKFITWPPAAAASPDAPIVVGVLGLDPFGAVLDQTLSGQTAGGRPFQIRRIAGRDPVTRCHILFISRSEKDRLQTLLSSLRGQPVLTVSEVDGFCHEGGQANFTIVEGKVKIEINQTECERAGLKVSSKLLSVAKVVQTAARN